MKILAIPTKRVSVGDILFDILASSLPATLEEGTIVCISSKIISLCEGRVKKISDVQKKDDLIIEESDYYLPRSYTPGSYVMHTIRDGILMSSAGIDASNSGEYYVLLPNDSYSSAKEIYLWLKKRYALSSVGVVITDSRSMAFRRGVVGISVGYYGFSALNEYRGTSDLFGRKMKISRANVVDSLASASVLAMGEGNESTPIALISEFDKVNFDIQEPLSDFHVPYNEDIQAPFFLHAPWKKGGKK